MRYGQATSSGRHCDACADQYGPLRLTVAGVMLCLALSLVISAEFFAAHPVDELKLMTPKELGTELVTTCRVFMAAKARKNGPAMRKALGYTDRVRLVLRERSGGGDPRWMTDLLTAMAGTDIRSCDVPRPKSLSGAVSN